MRKLLLFGLSTLFVAACSDLGVEPTDPLQSAPSVQLSHTESIVGAPTTYDLCGGLSPCDAFDYDRDGDGFPDGVTGVPGFCFLPPMVDNHLSDPACSGEFVPGLDGIFKLAWCQVEYDPPGDGTRPPTIVECQDPAEWQDLIQDGSGGAFYSTSVQWKRSDADDGDVFRLYVVRGDIHFAHRDVIIDPNLTTPADAYVHAIGYGTEPVKVRITRDLSCVKYDTQEAGTDNAATCLIAGATSLSFENDGIITTTFNFPDGNPTFLADFEVSECLSLGFYLDEIGTTQGSALVDTPLADCQISLSSEELESLTVPGQIEVTVLDDRWSDDPVDGAPFQLARLNVLQSDEFGVGALPPSADPGWFGSATNDVALLRWLDRGLDRLASLVGARSLYAAPGAGWDFTRMSEFQVAVMPVMYPDTEGTACATPTPYCTNLGTVGGADPVVPVSVKVSAPTKAGMVGADPSEDASSHIDVPDTRLHFFPETGTVSCPSGSGPDAFGRGCYEAGEQDMSTVPARSWDHVVVVTNLAGIGRVDWNLDGGENRLRVAACGVARPGEEEADPPGEPGSDGVWGTLGNCSDREASMVASGLDNGPADGLTPFEPVDTENEVAIYALPLEFEAETCPTITVDGVKGDAFGTDEWEACAEKTGFSAPLKGPKGAENAWLYTYNDQNTLYMALEVATDELGNKIFIQLAESYDAILGEFVATAGDDLLVDDFGDPAVPVDWHVTQACADNNSSSLCGDPDTLEDGTEFAARAAADVDGAGSGRVFYELSRPLESPNRSSPGKEDLDARSGDSIGLLLRVTQGQGGGKGGFVYPDPQTSPVTYHPFTLE